MSTGVKDGQPGRNSILGVFHIGHVQVRLEGSFHVVGGTSNESMMGIKNMHFQDGVRVGTVRLRGMVLMGTTESEFIFLILENHQKTDWKHGQQ
ncbi:MAG: hypothetical protein ACFFCZ_11380 [Promethearchaeota archaeon]